MKRNILYIGILVCFLLTGCGALVPKDNLSPKLKENINNQEGRIDRIENNQNAMRAEIDRLSLISKDNNNNGIQILQGEGTLFLIFCLITNFLVMLYFYKIAEGEKKTSQILAEQIIKHRDELLEINIKRAAENSIVEEQITQLLVKAKENIINKMRKNNTI